MQIVNHEKLFDFEGFRSNGVKNRVPRKKSSRIQCAKLIFDGFLMIKTWSKIGAWLTKHYLPEFAHHSFGHQTMADEALFGHQTMADEALFGSMAICEWCPRAIYDIGAKILIFHCFCTMEMFLFSKSIIPDENPVNISRRIFLDRSQGLKCTNKTKITFENLHATLDSQLM